MNEGVVKGDESRVNVLKVLKKGLIQVTGSSYSLSPESKGGYGGQTR